MTLQINLKQLSLLGFSLTKYSNARACNVSVIRGILISAGAMVTELSIGFTVSQTILKIYIDYNEIIDKQKFHL